MYNIFWSNRFLSRKSHGKMGILEISLWQHCRRWIGAHSKIGVVDLLAGSYDIQARHD
jgi:hypothetical protein